jgi:hypothetical protein
MRKEAKPAFTYLVCVAYGVEGGAGGTNPYSRGPAGQFYVRVSGDNWEECKQAARVRFRAEYGQHEVIRWIDQVNKPRGGQ